VIFFGHFVLTPKVWFRDSVRVWNLSLLANSVASNTLLTAATLLVSTRYGHLQPWPVAMGGEASGR
jgi:hypothetical protein